MLLALTINVKTTWSFSAFTVLISLAFWAPWAIWAVGLARLVAEHIWHLVAQRLIVRRSHV